jgi:hypothetical protein
MRPFALCLLAFSLTAFCQDPHAADREQLLKIFHEVEDSINSQSLERMAKQMDASATVVWANGEISRGPAEVLAYYDRMVKGNDAVHDVGEAERACAVPGRRDGGDCRWDDGGCIYAGEPRSVPVGLEVDDDGGED